MIRKRHIVVQEGRQYPVLIGDRILGHLCELLDEEASVDLRRCVVVVSPPVLRLYRDSIDALRDRAKVLLTVDDGESAKDLRTLEILLSNFASVQVRRGDVAIAIGGGVVGDLVGFASSIYLRGMEVVHVPTTLLAQVDSSVGGKTGVNLPAGKNLVGSLHYPRAVFSDVAVLKTLDEHQTKSGLFEALKSGVIADPELFEIVEKDDCSGDLFEVVDRSVSVKAAIVSADPREGDQRRLLNYGHTIGHAIEAALDYQELTHGEAVGWGMIAANEIAVGKGFLDEGLRSRIDAAVRRLAPRPFESDLETIERFTASDKKFTASAKVMTLPRSIGKCEIVEVSDDDIRRGIQAVLREA